MKAKIAIKSYKVAPFGDISYVMDEFFLFFKGMLL